ncbi:lipoyl(octanoyl) transferase LipB [Teredinibacter sp. KSP-S5-2]|uniref:lipoyl(octanoyl) transferase LipB n=1 Tax=Teredinibacter sp. KSP-S5-2 TaxID=3034506 RepID=UPI0029349D32|nr:lipoyl(octanoyl) transferase LipB [Teredinibacter sp. KSP-S5-2]WNO09509.1 lipoyl(octanoyl) transferase LipB [Teredinibacter sp. KSP-S5-2]
MTENRLEPAKALIVSYLGEQEYQVVWQKMQDYTNQRNADTPDVLWLVEHPAVYTQGQAGKPEHLIHANEIPVVKTDRGGQITYHGPGQLVAYPLLDLKRLGIGVRDLVTLIENSVIDLLKEYGITSVAKPDAPGVYVDGKKIASLGLRVRRGCSFHGVAINVDMDLSPFRGINPCGYAGLEMTDIRREIPEGVSVPAYDEIKAKYSQVLANLLKLTLDNEGL